DSHVDTEIHKYLQFLAHVTRILARGLAVFVPLALPRSCINKGGEAKNHRYQYQHRAGNHDQLDRLALHTPEPTKTVKHATAFGCWPIREHDGRRTLLAPPVPLGPVPVDLRTGVIRIRIPPRRTCHRCPNLSDAWTLAQSADSR